MFLSAMFLLCAVLALRSFSPAYATEDDTQEEIVTEDEKEPGESHSEEEKNEIPDSWDDTGERNRESNYSGEPDAESEANGDFSPSRKQQEAPKTTGNVRGPASVTQELHSYKVTATGLPESGVSTVEAEIVNAEGTVLHTLALTASGDWTATWETANPTEYYSVRMKSVLSPEGMDIAEAWLCSAAMTDEPRRPGGTETAWIERIELAEEGIYVFELQAQPGTLLAASNTRKQTYGYYYYPLTAESAVPENADSAARWSVSADYGAWKIENLGVPGCLSILQPASKSICAAFEETALSVSFENGVFRRQVNGVDTYLKFPGSTTTTTTSLSSASVFTAYQLTELTWYITGHSCELQFSENMSNRTTAVHVLLAIDGNIADRTKRFPFTVLLDGELMYSFTLGNGEEYRLDEVPCGASLTVQEDEGDYTVVSVSGEQSGNGIFHIDDIPQNEVNILFTNTLEGDIDTGIVTENGPWLLLLGIAILSGSLIIGTSKFKF